MMGTADFFSKSYEAATKVKNEMALTILRSDWAEKMTVKEVNQFIGHMEYFTRNRMHDLEPKPEQAE